MCSFIGIDDGWLLYLNCWQRVHSCTYLYTSLLNPTQNTRDDRRYIVFTRPACPAIGWSCAHVISLFCIDLGITSRCLLLMIRWSWFLILSRTLYRRPLTRTCGERFELNVGVGLDMRLS